MRVFIFAISLLIGTPTLAANWIYLSTSASNADYYIDVESIRDQKVSGQAVRLAWVKFDHSKDNSVVQRESKILYHFNCATSELRWVQTVDYRPDGTVLNSVTAPSYQRFSVAVPDTVGYDIMSAACS